MASAKIILYTSKILAGGTHPIVMRLTKDDERKYISLKYACNKKHWRGGKLLSVCGDPNYQTVNQTFREKETEANRILLENPTASLDEIMELLKPKKIKVIPTNLKDYIQTRIDDFDSNGQAGNAAVYLMTKNILDKFEENIKLTDVNLSFLQKFEAYMRSEGLKGNSMSIHFITLRAVINYAIGEGVLSDSSYPFKRQNNRHGYDVSILSEETAKRFISLEDIKKIKALDTPEKLAKDIFLFSFYCQGMSIVDIAHLKENDIYDNRIHYVRKKLERAKSRKQFSILITPQISEILNFYRGSGDYVFPIINPEIHKTPKQMHTRVVTVTKVVNEGLKIIAAQAGIQANISSYTARHSYAQGLRSKGVATAAISQALGHTTERTTQIYLAGFGDDVMDQINMDVTNI